MCLYSFWICDYAGGWWGLITVQEGHLTACSQLWVLAAKLGPQGNYTYSLIPHTVPLWIPCFIVQMPQELFKGYITLEIISVCVSPFPSDAGDSKVLLSDVHFLLISPVQRPCFQKAACPGLPATGTLLILALL